MNTKEILQKLHDVFVPKVELSEIETTTEETVEEVSQVELAEEPANEPAPQPEQTVEYATKLELEEMKRTFLEIIASWQKEIDNKQEVPQELSSDETVEVELSETEETIVHSPELEVEKKFDLYKPNRNNESIQAKIYSKLFN